MLVAADQLDGRDQLSSARSGPQMMVHPISQLVQSYGSKPSKNCDGPSRHILLYRSCRKPLYIR